MYTYVYTQTCIYIYVYKQTFYLFCIVYTFYIILYSILSVMLLILSSHTVHNANFPPVRFKVLFY